MSALKRKERENKNSSQSATKRQKLESNGTNAKAQAPEEKVKAIQQKSILSKEQPAFPRGGAGPLTLIEQKSIRAKATRDATREAEQSDLFGGKAIEHDESDQSDLDLDGIDEKQVFAEKKTKGEREKQKKGKSAKNADTVHIESVSSKKLNDESILLGRISQISSKELTISLPNNLTGYVPLTSVSDQFTSKLQKVVESQEADSDSDGEEDGQSNTNLKDHFKIGQTLRVAYRSADDIQDGKQDMTKRIILSTQPSLVNKGMSRKLLQAGITVQVSVTSIEDHGAIVDMGLEDGTTAFIAENALPADLALNSLHVGAVLLCTVRSASSKGKAVQLTPDLSVIDVAKASSSIEAYLPGTPVEVLLTQVSQEGLAGKILGLITVTADVLHSRAFKDKEIFTDKYQVGQKVVGRLIANFPTSADRNLAFSLSENLLELRSVSEDRFAPSSVIDRTSVISIVHGLGAYFSLPSGAVGFAHVSRLSDKKVDSLSEISGPYKPGTEHQARILDYNYIDDVYILSLQKSVIEQPFLRLADIQPGTVVKGTVEKILIGPDGVRGILVKVSPGITGHVSLMHFSDVALKNPEKKFREGISVKCRVLSVDNDRRRLDLTLKKTIVNSDQPVWSTYDDIEVGQSTVGTLIKINSSGAIVEFFGGLKGRLPVSEMSEAYIKDATEHFRIGQVLAVNILRIDAAAKRLTLTARDSATVKANDTSALRPGTLVTGTVFEKSADDLTLRLEPSGIIGRIELGHIADGSEKKRKSALEKIRVGQKLEDVLILEIKGRQVILSNKASLRKATEDGEFLAGFDALSEGKIVTGFVSNITADRVFVRFAQGVTGVINRPQIPDEQSDQSDFGMKTLQAVSARVIKIDYRGASPRFWLSMRASGASEPVSEPATAEIPEKEIVNPVDERLNSYADLKAGTVFDARITSVKDTQINVELAKGIQGRVDVSEVFDDIVDIHDHKRPLKQLTPKQVIKVKILGQHDSRTYKFLPLSHRSSKNVVFELSARPSVVSGKGSSILTLDDIQVGNWYPVFVNNVSEYSLMVNVSPAVRGRIRGSDVSDDLGMATNLARNFPIGSMIKAQVTAVDVSKNRLDLSAKTGTDSKILTLDSISSGDIVAGRITKITESSLLVQLSEAVLGTVDLVDMADDLELADTTRFQKNEVVRAYVLQVDQPNKKVYLSLRPSKILSSGLEVKDPELSLENLSIGVVCRGFIVNVIDKGIFVNLARGLRAFVRVTNLSDEFIKDWKDQFQRDQLVRGKIIALDKDSGHVQMSLRRSHIDGDYKPPVTINSLKRGDVVEATVSQIKTFGIFIVVANSENVRGLCHRSEIAEHRIDDATQLGFSEGDIVKAKVLKVEPEKKQINFGLKASYFDTEEDVDMEDTDDDEGVSAAQNDEADDTSDGQGIEIDLSALTEGNNTFDDESDDASIASNEDAMDTDRPTQSSKGLSVGGFDWFGMPSTVLSGRAQAESDKLEQVTVTTKKKKRKAEIMVDRTGDLDKHGPQSVDDFERLLLTDPDNAQLWVQFMAFYIDLGDIDAAREVAEKALKSIALAQEVEKQTVWVALLNVENTFGDDESVEAVLQRACQTMDAEDMHNKLASIYIQSGKHEKADDLFQTMTKKFTQDPKLWVNYATFLFDTAEEPAKARALLPRALQALPPFAHFDITSKFAQLEFKTKTGVPEEGRTRFQGLVNLYPKRLDLFSIMLDLEMKIGDADSVRAVFEQVLAKNLKPVKAKSFFARWLAYEKKIAGDDQSKVDEVQAKAARWVQQYAKTD